MIKVTMASLSLCSWSFMWYKTAMLEGKGSTGTIRTKKITTFNYLFVFLVPVFLLTQYTHEANDCETTSDFFSRPA